jgi:ATP-dependent RNA helicase DeaD
MFDADTSSNSRDDSLVGEPPTAPDDGPPSVGFDELGLDPRLVSAVHALGWTEATPIQAAAIQPMLDGRDVIGRARTGSGKTAAFGLPLVNRVIDGGRHVRALVLTPTRELAIQVADALKTFAVGTPIKIATIYGGAPYAPQLRALRSGASIVVGTPGRVIDHLERGTLKLGGVECFVLDEADEMLRMGFFEAVETIFEATPDGRQVALFSATMPDAIRRTANKNLVDPVIVQVEKSALTVEHIEQLWLRIPERQKLDALVRVLAAESCHTTLVFARTRLGCAAIAEELRRRGVKVDALHGDLNQAARERVLKGLRSERLDLVVATDVAARGIDVQHITHVINFDLPTDVEQYVHRIGRTGRAGRKGIAISFATPKEARRIQFFQNRLRVDIQQVKVPSDAAIDRQRRTRLQAELAGVIEAGSADHLKVWLAELMEETGWNAADIAVATLQQLTGGSLQESPSEEPPPWAQGPRRPQRQAPVRDDRDHRGDDRNHRGDDRNHRGDDRNHRGGDRPPHDRGPRGEDHVQVFFPIGRRRGVRAQDIVGALANDIGIPGHLIGRVSIHERKCFVGLSPRAAARLVGEFKMVCIRGIDVPVTMAMPNGSHREQPDESRPERTTSPYADRPSRTDGDGSRPFGSRKPFKR